MKYIESKPSGDGTFDHREVMECREAGRTITVDHNGSGSYFPCVRPKWYKDSIYRAAVPDTYGETQAEAFDRSSTLREVKGDAGPAVAEMLLDRIKELEEVINDLIRDHDYPMDSDSTRYFWNQARAALARSNGETIE